MKEVFARTYAGLGFCLCGAYDVFVLWLVGKQMIISDDGIVFQTNNYADGLCVGSFPILLLLSISWWLYFARIWKSRKFSVWLLDKKSIWGKIWSVLYTVLMILVSLMGILAMTCCRYTHVVNIDLYGETYDYVTDDVYLLGLCVLFVFQGWTLVIVPLAQMLKMAYHQGIPREV